MVKMFVDMKEAMKILGRSEQDVLEYAKIGRLREFRDGPRVMFKGDQVEQLAQETGGRKPCCKDNIPEAKYCRTCGVEL